MKDGITGFSDDAELLLHEEIAFWKDYINLYLASDDEPVPIRAYDALELAQLKLSLVQGTQNDQVEMVQLVH